MNRNPRQPGSANRLFVGWCALVIYVGAALPFGVALAAMIGSFDPDHHAQVQTEAGSTRLVLRHERNCAAHHHGLVARTLTLFAEPPSADQPDHVLQFSVSDSFSNQRQLVAPSLAQVDPPAVAVIEASAWSQREACVSQVPARPPPGANGQLLCLRSTLLLI